MTHLGFVLAARWRSGIAAFLSIAIYAGVAGANQILDPIALPSGVSAAAAPKLDPRLLLALSVPHEEPLLAALAGRVPMIGPSVDDLTFPVVIQSSLSDAELAELGARTDSRIGELVTARVSERDLGRLAEHSGVRAVEAAYRLEATLDISVPEVKANLVNNPNTGGFSGRGVLYGLLDDGLDLTHGDFRNAQGQSRVQSVWDQFAETGTAPKGFAYGREYTKPQIDAGQTTEFINDGGHGSHVSGIAVGDGSGGNTAFRGIAWEADIAVVRNGTCDLFCYGGGNPAWGDQTTTGAIDGMRYLKRQSMTLGKPLVINQSQGVTMGPHDGSTLFEAAYNTMITQQNIIIAVAAGNDQDAGWHGRQTVPANGSITFTMVHDASQQQGGPLPIIAFEVWYNPGKQFSYQLRTPSGQTVDIPAATNNQVLQTNSSHSDQIFYYSATANPVNQQGSLDVFMVNQAAGLEGGQWQLQVTSQGGSSGVVDFYGERNQANFMVSNPNLTSIVAMPGSATEVITVGSYNTRFEWPNSQGGATSGDGNNPVGEITTFSSQGPRRDGAQKPDLAAPGKWIVSSLAAGHQTNGVFITPDGQHHANLGTSMACPHVAGAIALMLEKDPSLTHTQVKQILQQTARHDGFTGAGWSPDFGHGKLDVQAAVNAVQGGGGSCSTTGGDSNLNGSVNVLDLVATVNHILGGAPLSKDAILCADLTGDQQVTINDVNRAVGVILNAGVPRPLAISSGASPIAWGESVDSRGYRLTLGSQELAGVQLSFILPRGFEMFGDPILHGATSDANVAWSEALGLYTLLAYDPTGRSLAVGVDPVTLEIPLLQTWDGEQVPADFAVTRLLLSDPIGGSLHLASSPSLEWTSGQPTGGMLGLLETMSPNPMVQTTDISYRIETAGAVRIEIFDPSGRKIRSLWNGHQMAGGHILPWDGRDDSGVDVPDGMYFVRVQAGGSTDSEKVLVVR